MARAVRVKLRKRGVNVRGVKCVFSPENPVRSSVSEIPLSQHQKFKRSYYGTMSYMPAVFGMHAAAHVIRKIGDRAEAGVQSRENTSSTEEHPDELDTPRSALEGYLYVI